MTAINVTALKAHRTVNENAGVLIKNMGVGKKFPKVTNTLAYRRKRATTASESFIPSAQDFIDDLKAGIKGETGLSATPFYTLLTLYLCVIIVGVSGNSLVLVSLTEIS
jgi:hypothetical protein